MSNQPLFHDILSQRRSVRQYDKNYKIAKDEMNEILETAIQAPSSSNLQPWRFIVIEDQALREKLLPIAYNQQQIVTSSAVIAVLGDINAYEHADKIYQKLVDDGSMTAESKEKYVSSIIKQYSNLSEEKRKEIALVDGGLISMQLMLAAKAKGYDTVPMGGYNAKQFIEMFNIPETIVPVMLIAIGKAEQEGRKTSRLPLEEVVSWNQL